MWFKNLQIYQLADWTLSSEELEARLDRHPLQDCLSMEMQSQGWVPPGIEETALVYARGGQILIALGVEKKLLPATVVSQLAKTRAQELEALQGYAPGRKQMREIRDAAHRELLVRAFAVRQRSHVWIDPENNWFVVEGASVPKADALVETFIKTTGMGLKRIRTMSTPVATMTGWVSGNEPPAVFSIDSDSVFRSRDDKKVLISYARQEPAPQEVARHVGTGKEVIRLAMTWNNEISFVLEENLQLKRLTLLDMEREPEESPEEQFISDFFLMTAQLQKLLPDLLDALGGIAQE